MATKKDSRFAGLTRRFRKSTTSAASTQVAVEPSALSGTTTKSAAPSLIQCSRLWEDALDRVTQHPEWTKYCQILDREQAGLSKPKTTDPGQLKTTPAAPQSQAPPMASTNLDANDVASFATAVRDCANAAPSAYTRKFIGLCNFITKFKDIGVALIALNPYASLAWGIVEFIAGAITNNAAIRQACWGGLDSVSTIVRRCKILEDLYKELNQQQAHGQSSRDRDMTNLFTSILRYQILVVVTKYSKLEGFRNLMQPATESKPAQLLNEIKAREDDLLKTHHVQQDQLQVEWLKALMLSNDASLAAIENKLNQVEDSLDALRQGTVDLLHYATEQERSTVLKWLSPLEYGDLHVAVGASITDGTYEWFLQHPTFEQWLSASDNEVFWLRGMMGSGKTFLTHAVIDFLRAKCDCSAEVLAYYYCSNLRPDFREQMSLVDNILRILIKQLAHSFAPDAIPAYISNLYKAKAPGETLNRQDCENLLANLASCGKLAYIIVDGLDECPLPVRSALVQVLCKIASHQDNKLKLFFAGRDDVAVRDILEGKASRILNVDSYNAEPIRKYIEQAVGEASHSDSLRHLYVNSTERTHIAAVTETLNRYAQGMFRWVSSAFDFLHSSPTFDVMGDRLQKLPQVTDLFDLYHRLYTETIDNLGSRRARSVRTLLSYLLSDSRMPPRERNAYVGEACAFSAREADDPTPPPLKVIDCWRLCPSLLKLVDPSERDRTSDNSSFGRIIPASGQQLYEAGLSLQISHSSVVQFLRERKSELFNRSSVSAYMAQLCLDFFEPVGYEDRCAKYPILHSYASTRWYHHLSSLGRFEDFPALKSSMSKFLSGDRPSSSYLLWYHGPRISSSGSAVYMQLFRTEPPSSFLPRMCLDFDWKTTNVSIGQLEMRMGKQFDLDDDYVNILGHFVSPLEFAAAIGAVDAIPWLVSRGFDVNATHTCTHQFCSLSGKGLGFVSIVLRMTSNFKNLPFRRATPLEVTLRMLIQQGLNAAASPNADIMLAFTIGANCRLWNRSVMTVLDDAGVLITSVDGDGSSLLEKALCSHHFAVIYDSTFVDDIFPRCLGSARPQKTKNRELMLAVMALRADWILSLIRDGADPCHISSRYGSLLSLTRYGFELHTNYVATPSGLKLGEIMDVLTSECLDRGFDLGSLPQLDKYLTFTELVARFSSLHTVKSWVEHGVDPFHRHVSELSGNQLESGMDAATQSGRTDIVEYFESLRAETTA